MEVLDEKNLIYDWNELKKKKFHRKKIELDDETLRDGLQSPSVTTPSIDKKIEILHAINELGIQIADIGLAGAGPMA